MPIKYKEPYIPLHVVFATDKRGLYFTTVAIASLVRTQKERRLRISVLVDRLDEPSKSVLSSVADGRSNVEVEFIDIHDKIAQYIPFLEANSGHWPYMVWARCFIDKVFPEENGNILYLDYDILVVDDVAKIIDQSYGENLFAAVPESLTSSGGVDGEPIGESRKGSLYFNSGVLLFNMPAYRAAGGSEKIMELLRQRTGKLRAPDQDILNLMANGKFHPLHPRWNCNDGNLDRQFQFMLKSSKLYRGNPPRKLLEALLNPAILHFLGKHKPWLHNHRPERRRYLKLMRELGLAKTFLPGATLAKIISMLLFDVYHAILRKVAWLRLKVGI